MELSPASEFFRYFGSNGELPAASTSFPTPIEPSTRPQVPATTDEPALDGLGIEETAPPSVTLDDGTPREPTHGTHIPAPIEDGAAPAPADGTPTPAEETPAPAGQ
jgi:membrane protease subunit HflC